VDEAAQNGGHEGAFVVVEMAAIATEQIADDLDELVAIDDRFAPRHEAKLIKSRVWVLAHRCDQARHILFRSAPAARESTVRPRHYESVKTALSAQ